MMKFTFFGGTSTSVIGFGLSANLFRFHDAPLLLNLNLTFLFFSGTMTIEFGKGRNRNAY